MHVMKQQHKDPMLIQALTERVGERVKSRRMELGMSQTALSKNSGIHPSAISKIEGGTLLPTLARLVLLAEALGVPASALLDAGEIVEAHHGRS